MKIFDCSLELKNVLVNEFSQLSGLKPSWETSNLDEHFSVCFLNSPFQVGWFRTPKYLLSQNPFLSHRLTSLWFEAGVPKRYEKCLPRELLTENVKSCFFFGLIFSSFQGLKNNPFTSFYRPNNVLETKFVLNLLCESFSLVTRIFSNIGFQTYTQDLERCFSK